MCPQLESLSRRRMKDLMSSIGDKPGVQTLDPTPHSSGPTSDWTRSRFLGAVGRIHGNDTLLATTHTSGNTTQMATKDPKIEKFSGDDSTDVNDWLARLELRFLNRNITTDKLKLSKTASLVTGEAFRFFASTVAPIRSTIMWEDFHQRFTQRFRSLEPNPCAQPMRHTMPDISSQHVVKNCDVSELPAQAYQRNSLFVAIASALASALAIHSRTRVPKSPGSSRTLKESVEWSSTDLDKMNNTAVVSIRYLSTEHTINSYSPIFVILDMALYMPVLLRGAIGTAVGSGVGAGLRETMGGVKSALGGDNTMLGKATGAVTGVIGQGAAVGDKVSTVPEKIYLEKALDQVHMVVQPVVFLVEMGVH
ncbi:unnamed protein product [Oppiella nova]|uniref:Uncharacterized protein n=1 Tax=Oppiella nova TaxID=334625 RepID=A0A7R9MDE9_9ACAR|nr:unnamed protein product [Oppiella nova]CAG2175171.1 unnamed protein product [Oppiella nova]